MKRKILIVLVVVFVGIQFIPVASNESTEVLETDFITSTNPPTEVAQLLKNSCYDCHSNNTRYPWYDKVAPVSWWVKSHIDEGKDELNFSEWTSYSKKRRNHKLKEIMEEVEEEKMPLESYLIMHGNAKVTPEQLEQLKSFINTIKD